MAAKHRPPMMRFAALALIAASLGACAGLQAQRPAPPAPAAAPSHSVAEADRRLAQAARDRTALEAEFAASEQVCYAKFFVNNCLDTAKEKRRSGLAALRAIEVEAAHFKRQAAAEERDRALAESEKEFAAQEAQRAAIPPKPARAAEADTPPPPRPVVDRVGKQAARVKQLEAQEQAGAGQRAANVAAFEKKRLESEQRQKKVAAKKAEKAAKAAKEAEDAKNK